MILYKGEGIGGINSSRGTRERVLPLFSFSAPSELITLKKRDYPIHGLILKLGKLVSSREVWFQFFTGYIIWPSS